MKGIHAQTRAISSLTTIRLAQAVTITLMSVLLLSAQGCGEQPQSFVPGVTDKFDVHVNDSYRQADALLQADYVFVMDYSSSMHDKSEEIVTNMKNFGTYLEGQQIDYRVGLIGGTFQGNVAKSKAWPRISTDFMGPYLTLADKGNMAADIEAQLRPLGTDTAPNKRSLLESALKTMDAQAADFLRPAAQLVYIFMSDNDDTSNIDFDKGTSNYASAERTTAFYDTKLSSYKVDPAFISSRSFTAGVATSCPLESTGDGGDAAGTRLAQASRLLDETSDYPAFKDGCIYNPTTDQLQSIARDVSKSTAQFILRGTPLEGSVKIFTAAAGTTSFSEVPSDGNWNYDRATNQITFVAGKEPAKSAKIKIVYDQGFYLTKKPKLASVEVLIDGKLVPQSASNGWSYVESENRIAFNGGALPPNDSKVVITYQNAL